MRVALICWLALGLGVLGAGADPAVARAELKDAKGQSIGTAELTDATNGVLVRLRLSKAPSGVHAFHVHEIGKCDAPSFDSAGPHLNPAKAQHGLVNPSGFHTGDLPNLHIPPNGKLDVELFVSRASLAPGASSMLDGDGAALVLHAAADDYTSDPAGNAGDRVACGVIMR